MLYKSMLFVGLVIFSSCAPAPDHKRELKISVNDDGTKFFLHRSEKLQSIGMFAVWEDSSDSVVWAVSGVYPDVDEVVFGDPPTTYKGNGWAVASLRQLFPVNNERPVKLSKQSAYYLVAEITVDYMLDSSLDMVVYELKAVDGKFAMTMRTDKSAYKLPDSVSQLWDEKARYWERREGSETKH